MTLFTGVVLMTICCSQPVTAGNRAYVAATGVGRLEANISYVTSQLVYVLDADGVTLIPTLVSVTNLAEAKSPATGYYGTVNVTRPSAGVFFTQPVSWNPTNPATAVIGGLPPGCPTTNFCIIQSQYSAGSFKAKAVSNVSAGSVADNPELELKIPVTPAACANLDVDAELINGRLTLSGTATDGTAVWLRALKYTGNIANPTISELLASSVLKGELTVAGPFNTTADCPMSVPVSGGDENLYFLVDTVARSIAYTMTVNGGNPVIVECKGGSQQYPSPSITGGCEAGGQASVSYSPPASALVLGVPTQVLVTAMAANDPNVILARTLFTATLVDTFPPTITAPASLTSVPTDPGLNTAAKANVNLGTPVSADSCGVASVVNNAPAQFPLGATTVIWTVTDTSGKKATATQTVTVVDKEKPTITAPANVTSSFCNGTGVNLGTPTTADNVGVASVVNNAPATFAVGTTTVTWTVTDTSGNSATATQTVTVTGLTFDGFLSPVGTVNNSVGSAVSRTAGASFPLKWNLLCGSSYITGGTPPVVSIVEINTSGAAVGPVTNLTAEYQNDWHINWPTASTSKFKYFKATVNLADGSKPYVIVRFK